MCKINNVEIHLEVPKQKNTIDEFDTIRFNYYGYITKIEYISAFTFKIKISSNFSDKLIFEYFSIILKLLFFNYGYFMEINSYKVNNEIVNYKNYCDLDFYKSNVEYVNSYKITSIPNVIKPLAIKKIKEEEQNYFLGFRALYYLKSNNYSSVLYDHKFTILCHILEGFIENSSLEKEILLELQKKQPNKKKLYFEDRITYYTKKLLSISKKTNSSIYTVLKENSKKLPEKIKNTRNQYSHYVRKKKTIEVKNSIYYFYIMELVYRIILLDKCGVKYDISLKNNLQNIHDWILTNTRNLINENDYKTLNYKIRYRTNRHNNCQEKI